MNMSRLIVCMAEPLLVTLPPKLMLLPLRVNPVVELNVMLLKEVFAVRLLDGVVRLAPLKIRAPEATGAMPPAQFAAVPQLLSVPLPFQV